MINLTHLQRALLTSACERTDGALLPGPDDLRVAPNRVRKAAGQLVELGLAEERETPDQPISWRADGDTLFGAFINDAGRAALAPTEPEQRQAELKPAPPAPARTTKTDLLLEMLSKTDGASIDELIAATSWLPHTARAAITMLKKKGHAVIRLGERGVSRYRIVEIK